MPIGGCLLVVLAVVLWVAALLGPAGPVIVALPCALLIALYVAMRIRKSRVAAAFRERHGAEKDLLIVYSDSPHWREYIESNWLPRWGHRGVAFNRSRAWSEQQMEARLWRAVAGQAEYTPVVIVVRRRGRPRIVRFFLAFRDFEHGKDRKLREAEARLEGAPRRLSRLLQPQRQQRLAGSSPGARVTTRRGLLLPTQPGLEPLTFPGLFVLGYPPRSPFGSL